MSLLDTVGDNHEKDLFDLAQKQTWVDGIKSYLRSGSSPAVHISAEKLIIVLAVAAILLLVSFVAGFVRGRSVTSLEGMPSRSPQAVSTYSPALPPAAVSAPVSGTDSMPRSNVSIVTPQPPAAPKAVANTGKKPYTIQLATYRDKSRASKEVSDLKGQGFKARLTANGRYYEVSAGAYAGREDAAADLKRLKSRFKDCYLKKVE